MMPTLPDRRLLCFLLVALVVLMPVRRAQAQTAGPEIVSVDASAYPTVSVLVDVPQAGLADAGSATVIENGHARPASVAGAGQGHLEVVLVMDTSGSMSGGPLDAAKAAATAFVSSLPTGTSVAIVGFGAHPYVVTPMTPDPAALQNAIARLRADGETALYDALSLGVDQFSPAAGPRSVVLVSDGGDTASTTPLDAVTAKLTAAHARFFGVQLATPEANRPVLDGLAAATKGRTVEAGDAPALRTTYQDVASDAVHQVRLTYASTGHGTAHLAVRLGTSASTSGATVELPAAPPPPPTTAPPARPAPAPRPKPESTTALALGAAAIFGAILLAASLTIARPPQSLLAREHGRARKSGLETLKGRASQVMERTLERNNRRQKLGARLEEAGIALRPGEYVVAVAAVASLGGATGVLLGGFFGGVIVALLVVAVAWTLLAARTNRRRRDLEKQLPELLQQLTSGLRAGYGVMQALDAVSHEIASPMADEVHRLVTEVQLGRPLPESLRAMGDRVGGQDFSWVVQAIEINREIGGDLSEVLDAVAGTIRARNTLRRQVRTLSAQGRLSARILLAMPLVMAVLLSLVSPGYLSPLATHSAGTVLVVVGAMFMLVGWVWMRRIVRPEF